MVSPTLALIKRQHLSILKTQLVEKKYQDKEEKEGTKKRKKEREREREREMSARVIITTQVTNQEEIKAEKEEEEEEDGDDDDDDDDEEEEGAGVVGGGGGGEGELTGLDEFLVAVRENRVDRVREELARDGRLARAAGAAGRTALMGAAEGNRVKAMLALMEPGAGQTVEAREGASGRGDT